MFTKNRLGIEEQCMVVIDTKKGNSLLFLFLNIPHNPERKPFCTDDYSYELLNMDTFERFVLSGKKYSDLVDSKYFFNIRKTAKYLPMMDDLMVKSNFNFILTCEQ
jgi:hypothetical protein